MDVWLLSLLFFGALFLALALGVPIAVALGGISIIFIHFFWNPGAFYMVVLEAFGKTSNFAFLAIPLFLFMAVMLEKAGIAEALYVAMYRFFGAMKGGLAIGTVAICTLFAAMAGVSGAATVAMGVLALPSMLNRGYDKSLALGCVSAGGALGILIPPSITMIVYGLVANVSVGKLYAGGILPGLLLGGLFCLYILIRSAIQPHLAPAVPKDERYTWQQKFNSLKGVIMPVLLVFAVLGGIFFGVTSVSEAAAIGALGSIVCSTLNKRLNMKLLGDACERTLLISCLIMWIIVGAAAFSTFYVAIGAADFLEELVLGLPINKWAILALMQLILLLMGMVMETTGIIMVTVPVFSSIITALGFDPTWYGVLFIINMEMGFLTPPFGYNLFYLKGVAPDNVTMMDLYRSVTPYVLLQLLGLILCIVFPSIITILPKLIFGG